MLCGLRKPTTAKNSVYGENAGKAHVTNSPNHGELKNSFSSQSVLTNYTIVIGVVNCLDDILPLVEELE